MQSWCYRGSQGRHGRPTCGLPSKNIFKPRIICTLDSSIHFNIVVVSAVQALHTILNDTKKEGVVFWTYSQMQIEVVVVQTCSQLQN